MTADAPPHGFANSERAKSRDQEPRLGKASKASRKITSFWFLTMGCVDGGAKKPKLGLVNTAEDGTLGQSRAMSQRLRGS